MHLLLVPDISAENKLFQITRHLIQFLMTSTGACTKKKNNSALIINNQNQAKQHVIQSYLIILKQNPYNYQSLQMKERTMLPLPTRPALN